MNEELLAEKARAKKKEKKLRKLENERYGLECRIDHMVLQLGSDGGSPHSELLRLVLAGRQARDLLKVTRKIAALLMDDEDGR